MFKVLKACFLPVGTLRGLQASVAAAAAAAVAGGDANPAAADPYAAFRGGGAAVSTAEAGQGEVVAAAGRTSEPAPALEQSCMSAP